MYIHLANVKAALSLSLSPHSLVGVYLLFIWRPPQAHRDNVWPCQLLYPKIIQSKALIKIYEITQVDFVKRREGRRTSHIMWPFDPQLNSAEADNISQSRATWSLHHLSLRLPVSEPPNQRRTRSLLGHFFFGESSPSLFFYLSQ